MLYSSIRILYFRTDVIKKEFVPHTQTRLYLRLFNHIFSLLFIFIYIYDMTYSFFGFFTLLDDSYTTDNSLVFDDTAHLVQLSLKVFVG